MAGQSLLLLLASGLFIPGVEAQSVFSLSPQNIVQRGSFEFWTGPFPAPPSPWVGNYGLAAGYDGAADGRNFATLTSTTWFAAQTLTTIPSQAYQVTFAVSGNSSFPGLSIVQLSWDGVVVGNTTWISPYTPGDGHNFDWVYGSFDVVATSSSTLLSFQRNPASTSSGTFLDAVQVVPVPEPSNLCLLSIGVLALIANLRSQADLPKALQATRGSTRSSASWFRSFGFMWQNFFR